MYRAHTRHEWRGDNKYKKWVWKGPIRIELCRDPSLGIFYLRLRCGQIDGRNYMWISLLNVVNRRLGIYSDKKSTKKQARTLEKGFQPNSWKVIRMKFEFGAAASTEDEYVKTEISGCHNVIDFNILKQLQKRLEEDIGNRIHSRYAN